MYLYTSNHHYNSLKGRELLFIYILSFINKSLLELEHILYVYNLL